MGVGIEGVRGREVEAISKQVACLDHKLTMDHCLDLCIALFSQEPEGKT